MTDNHADNHADEPDRPHHSDAEIDRRFDEIVAAWDVPAADPTGPDGAADTGADAAADPADPAPAATKPFQVPAQWRAGTGPSIVEEHEEEFVPVEPDLPGDEGFWVTLGCLVLGPLWLLYLFFFDRYAAALWWVLAAGVCLTGIAMMVLRQPKNRDDDDPFDDGARL